MADEDTEHVSVGCEIWCDPAISASILDDLRNAVGDILDAYDEDDISDYGVG